MGRRWPFVLAPLALAAAAGGWALRAPRPSLPAGLAGVLVYASDRTGLDSLYLRRLPSGEDRRLTFFSEPVGEPAVSPDGRHVAFSMGGRIGVLSLEQPSSEFVTVGIDWRDGSPAWRTDGRALVVTARPPGGGAGDIHLLELRGRGQDAVRRRLTETRGLDETSPVFGPRDGSVLFVRQDNVFLLDLAGGSTRKLTAGFKTFRAPRLTPSGRVLLLWSEGKKHGIDLMDADGRNHETLLDGLIYYRSVAPSPDGRFLAATFTFDLGFEPRDVLRLLRHPEEVHLLDARGATVAPLARAWLHANHSPDWR